MNYGRNPRSPIAYTAATYATSDRPDWNAEDLARRINESLNLAKACLVAAQDRDKHYADLKRAPAVFIKDQWVLLSTKNLSKAARLSEEDKEVRKKLFPRFIGPFQVTRAFPEPDPDLPKGTIIDTVAVELKLPQKFARIHPIFHASLIRPFKASEGTMPPAPEWDQKYEWFEVAKIMDHRTVGKRKRARTDFKIRWVGYSEFYDSWEPQKEIQRRAPEVIKEYWAEKAAADLTS